MKCSPWGFLSNRGLQEGGPPPPKRANIQSRLGARAEDYRAPPALAALAAAESDEGESRGRARVHLGTRDHDEVHGSWILEQCEE